MGKFGWTVSVGVGIGGIAMIVSLVKGDPFGETLGMIPAGIMLCAIVAYAIPEWFNENVERGETINPQILKLQSQLRTTLDAAAMYEKRGEYTKAGYARSDAAVIEAQLRNLGS